MKFSRLCHSAASSWSMWCCSPHPQQVQETSSVLDSKTSSQVMFISLITGNSIAQPQKIATFFLNYFPRPIQVANDRIWRLRRAWRLSLRYRAFHLSAVLSKTFLIVSLLISIPRVCVFFQKKSTQMTKKLHFLGTPPP